jgi:hypothetical protein
MFYTFIFADGYYCTVRGMSKQELKVEERKHGKLVRKVMA